MSGLLRAELLKHRSTTTTRALAAAMLTLVVFAMLLHGFGLDAAQVDSRDDQLTVLFGWGAVLGALFAGLLGALALTAEHRHGTIRPTFLVTPRRARVVAAKAGASMAVAAGFGLVAAVVAVGLGSAVLAVRGIGNTLSGADIARLVAGGAGGAALWAAIGVGAGAVVRQQVPALIGISAWLLFVENLLTAYVTDAGRLAPGAAAAAAAGLNPGTLLAPAAGLLLLALYAAAAVTAGTLATTRRDVT